MATTNGRVASRIVLREATIMDAERTLAEIDQEASKALKRFAESRVTLADQRAYLNRIWNSPTDKLYLVEFDPPHANPLGSIGLHEIDWANGVARVGMMIFRPGDRGLGYGSEAIGHLHRIAFEELGLHRLHANVIASNAKNLSRFMGLGYRFEGVMRERYLRNGVRHDMALLSLLSHEWRG